MKKMKLIAGIVSVAAVGTVLWSMPAIAETGDSGREARDKWPGADNYAPRETSTASTATGLPEPGTLALLALGLGGLGGAALRRRRAKA
jgi:hypothetical protein